MNKYFVKIPYSYVRYGDLTVIIYAEDEESAEQLAYNSDNWHSEDYEDNDDCGGNEYNYDDMTIELEEEDVESSESNRISIVHQMMLQPCKFSSDLIRL